MFQCATGKVWKNAPPWLRSEGEMAFPGGGYPAPSAIALQASFPGLPMRLRQGDCQTLLSIG